MSIVLHYLLTLYKKKNQICLNQANDYFSCNKKTDYHCMLPYIFTSGLCLNYVFFETTATPPLLHTYVSLYAKNKDFEITTLNAFLLTGLEYYIGKHVKMRTKNVFFFFGTCNK